MDIDTVSPVNELEQQLRDAGNQLTFPPSNTTDLLALLDKIKQLLTLVGQAPSISMQGALVPPMGALIAKELIKHSEIDVRISVASCLCEVARITAPEPSYNDEIMKDIFQLNVLAFEQLSNMTGQSYYKAVHILESVAKVKLCLLMLDLECDELVLEMFKQFLSKIRISHPPTVFSDIETIMTTIIEESDEIATELLSLLISHVRKENQIVSPASWKLAEKVLRNCNDTLKPYRETIRSLVNSNLDDYAEVVTFLCRIAREDEHIVARSTRTNSTQKRDLITLENGGSVKKQKYINKDQFKEKELETRKRGRPKKNKSDLHQVNTPNLVQNRKPFSDKRVANSSRSKDIPKKWGKDLVGQRIKVWWPLDETYYTGVVASYDPLDDKHKVLYADGDEEVLCLRDEKWKMLSESSPYQKQGKVTDMPSSMTTIAMEQKIKSSPTLEDNSSSLKSLPPADSPKTTDGDTLKDDMVPKLDIICALPSIQNTTDVAKNADSYPSGEQQEKNKREDTTTTGENRLVQFECLNFGRIEKK